jgi:hypothetical protein
MREWVLPTEKQAGGGDMVQPSAEQMKPYEDALWDWFLETAVVPDWYGGAKQPDTRQVREHLATCGIDREYSSLPTLGRFGTFKGTFADDNTAPGVVCGVWRCNCDERDGEDAVSWYGDGDLVVEGEFSLGEIIYQVVQNGLGVKAEPGEG